jgi:ribosomal protein S18 acetylase RimI-like enzyme
MIASIALPVGFATAYSRRSPVGYGMAVLDRGMIGLFNIAVCDTARGQGIGKKLTAALLRWGRTQDATGAYLHVLESNSIARSLYKKLGFVEIYRYHYRKEPVVAR